MSDHVYRELCETMKRRGGRYPGVDIPEFYEMARALFTPEEAAVSNAMPRGFHTAETIAERMGRPPGEIAAILEQMADKGLAASGTLGDTPLYGGVPFVPGIFEFQFMRGTATEYDRTLARLIHAYKAAVDSMQGVPAIVFPSERVIPINEKIKVDTAVQTYDQVAHYIEKVEPISVSTCFCRHEALLIDETDVCDKPMEVCMQFGRGAQFIIDRKLGRRISREEAADIIRRSEAAGLVHCTANRQDIDFLCNCCSCHCMILQTAMAQPRPGLALTSGYIAAFDPDRCTACGGCIDICPATALVCGDDDVPRLNADRCFGCGVCAAGCPGDAIELVARPDSQVPPENRKALKEALRSGNREGTAPGKNR